MTDSAEIAAMVVEAINAHSFSFANEDELQRAIAEILPKTSTRREVKLSARDRIDFMVGAVGVEVKIKGSLAALTRQIHRYAQLEKIEALVVVTPLARLTRLPAELSGKPVHVCHLLWSCF